MAIDSYQPSVSVIFPVFNEVELTETAIRELDNYLIQLGHDYEIIVIESGSTDGTREICDQLAKELVSLIVLHQEKREGFGSAVRIGYSHASKDLIWLVTADIPFPLKSLETALPLAEKYECILSYRKNDNRKLFRRIQSFVFQSFIYYYMKLPMKNINSAFKLYHRDFIQSLNLKSTGWSLDAEVLLWIEERKVKFIEIPVDLIERSKGKSKVSITDPIIILIETLKLKNRIRREKND